MQYILRVSDNGIPFFIFIILLFIACSADDNPVEPGPPEIPGESGLVKPVEIVFPEAVFTDPQKIGSGQSSPLIIDRLIELIDATPDYSSIYMSIFLFDYTPLVMALMRAGNRGVYIHLMIDMSNRSDNRNTINALQSTIENIEIIEVTNDAGSIAINHNKFVLFPEVTTSLGTAYNVVFQTSQNFINAGTEKIQDAVIFSNQDLYEAYFAYWMDTKPLASSGMSGFEYREFTDSSGDITAYFYPKRKNGEVYGGDTMVEILSQITDPASTTIRIGMSEWTDTRLDIMNKLSQLLSDGATIEVISKSSIAPEVYEALKDIEKQGSFVLIYNMGSSGQRINIHSKMMLISGSWNGSLSDVLVTGSQNFTRNALQNNNEVTLLLRNHELFEAYQDYFEELKQLPGICCPE